MKDKRLIQNIIFSTLAIGILAGCAASPPLRSEVARRLAAPAFMIEREIPAGNFSLSAYERMHERYAPANVYIEGDGESWMSRVTDDPTPKNPLALHLASRDLAENVVWLARPCQFSVTGQYQKSYGMTKDGECAKTYWNEKRFSPEVISAYNAALDEIKTRYNITEFNLIGYDGGAAVASILAAERKDVKTLRTVAGNLDHKAFTDFHNRPQLAGSLNPIDFANQLRTIPQIHFTGGQDEVVKPAVTHSYLQAIGNSPCIAHEMIQEAGHEQGWVDKWPDLLKRMPYCEAPIEQPFEFIPPPEPIRIQRELGKTK